MDLTEDGRIETSNPLQHWFAWRTIQRHPLVRQQPLQRLADKCGVISRHITTHVLSPLLRQWRICPSLLLLFAYLYVLIVVCLLACAYSVPSFLLPNFFE
jgi:hypothetical protein